MTMEIKKMYLSSDYTQEDLDNQKTDSTDVIIHLRNGEKLAASFFTYDYIENWKANKEGLRKDIESSFFWAPNMVIVKDCSRDRVADVVQYLIDEGDFLNVFKLLHSKKETSKQTK